MKRIVFVRDFRGFTGGHLKVFHYFNHVLASRSVEAKIYFTPASRWDPTNPWFGSETPISTFADADADAFFVAGLDWDIFDRAEIDLSRKPVINLVQGVRHANPADPRFRFLSREAIRICVSNEIAARIQETERVRGKVIVIEAGIDLDDLKRFKNHSKSELVFLGGSKNPGLAARLASDLARHGIKVDLQTRPMPRDAFLTRLAAASIAVLLPLREEGFFLPALEAMVVGAAVVVPDCVGNRSFCLPGKTCLMPDYSHDGLREAVLRLAADSSLQAVLVNGGYETAKVHSLTTERKRFHSLLDYVVGNHVS
jgi:glycosyltransferase involved in cell wall biosynthesis